MLNFIDLFNRYCYILKNIENNESIIELSDKTNFSESTLKRNIKEIEDMFGIKVFVPRSNNTLTSEAKELKRLFLKIQSEVGRYIDHFSTSMNNKQNIEIAIAYPATFYNLIDQLDKRLSFSVNYHTDYSSSIISKINNNEDYDIGFVYIDDMDNTLITEDKHLKYVKIFTEHLFLLSNIKIDDISILQNMTELSILPRNVISFSVDNWWNSNFETNRNIIYVPNVTQLYRLLKQSPGKYFSLLYLNKIHGASWINDMCCSQLTENGRSISHSLYLIWNETSEQIKFFDRLVEESTSLVFDNIYLNSNLAFKEVII